MSVYCFSFYGYFFIVRNIPLLYYCTEYGIFRYHVTRFSGLDLTSVGGLELPIKGGYIFIQVVVALLFSCNLRRTINKNKNKNTFAFAYPVDLSTPPCSTNIICNKYVITRATAAQARL
jgi:hypothetical protein